MNHPKYNIIDFIVVFFNLMHWGAIILAALFGIIGLGCNFFSEPAAIVLFSIASFLFIVQIVSRAHHMFSIRTVRPSGNSFIILHRETGKRFSPDKIQCVRKKEFAYPDQWRPFTFGYPGLEIQLTNIEEPVAHLYPCGLEYLRDKMFTYLKLHLPANVQFEEE
jgi:hypothetical protein